MHYIQQSKVHPSVGMQEVEPKFIQRVKELFNSFLQPSHWLAVAVNLLHVHLLISVAGPGFSSIRVPIIISTIDRR